MTAEYGICPLCDQPTYHDGGAISFGVTKCRTCPYELHQLGSYACEAVIDGEKFFLEDGYGDERKFEERIKEWKKVHKKGPWQTEGF